MLTAIRQWVIKTMMKGNTGVVQTMPKQQIIEMNVQITAQRMMQNGINPNDLKTVGQVENVINQIEQPKVNVNPGMTSGKKADVIDMEGNKLDPEKPILGGKQETSIDQESFLQRVKKAVDEDREIKARLNANNQKGIGRLETNNFALNTITKIKSMKPMDAMKEANLVAGKKGRYANLDDNQVNKIIDDTQDHIFERDIPEEDFATGGRAGYKFGIGPLFNFLNKKSPVKAYTDYLKSVKERVKAGKEAEVAGEVIPIAAGGALITNQVKKKLKAMNEEQKKKIKEEMENKADGGRIGLKAGMTKRAFLKLMGAGAAGVGAVKSGIFSGFGKGTGKQVAKEVAQQTTSSMPPPYFFKLAEKIKKMGDDVTATTDRTISKSLKSKDGNAEYILEEDITSGDTIIKKINKEGDDMITDVQIMEFRKGEDVVTKEGKALKTPDEYEEVTEVNKRIYKDDYNASDYTDGIEEIELKKIIDEVDDQAPSIKYASGGLAYMLGE